MKIPFDRLLYGSRRTMGQDNGEPAQIKKKEVYSSASAHP